MQLKLQNEGEVLLAIKLVIFFASNPEQSLTREEIERKYGVVADYRVHRYLQGAFAAGLLAKRFETIKGHKAMIVSAGPAILKELGYD